MSLGPLVPRSDVPRNNDGSQELQPSLPAEVLRPIGSALYNVLPSQESTLREYMRVLIKRKWLVISVVLGIFTVVAVASLRQTPIYEASGQINCNSALRGVRRQWPSCGRFQCHGRNSPARSTSQATLGLLAADATERSPSGSFPVFRLRAAGLAL